MIKKLIIKNNLLMYGNIDMYLIYAYGSSDLTILYSNLLLL